MDTVTLELTVRFIVDRGYLGALYSIAVSENPLPVSGPLPDATALGLFRDIAIDTERDTAPAPVSVSGRIAPERGPAHES